MKSILSLLLFLPLIAAHAATYYVTQNGAGTHVGSVTNPWSVSDFNTFTNWSPAIGTSGKISPGDTVTLQGTITTQLFLQGSGSLGNPITIKWDTNAKLSRPAGTLITATNRSYLVFDGGVNGIIENTANGSQLAYQIGASGIYSQSGSVDVEVKDLNIQNLYVHTLVSDAIIDEGSNAALLFRGIDTALKVSRCTFSNVCWAIMTSGTGTGSIVEDCSFSNYDHGVVSGNNPIQIVHNHFGTTANWDTTTSRYHHDGIHIFFGTGQNLGPVLIERNLFDGDWGSSNTAHIFIEGNYTHLPDSTQNFTIRNNVHIQYPNNYLNNGFATGGGTNWVWENNTYVGSGVLLSTAVRVTGSNIVFKNNVVSGVTTFVSVPNGNTFDASGLDNNVYAAQVPSGNSPFSYNGSAISSFANWKTATGQDASSQYITSADLNADGSLMSTSTAIGAALDLSAFFVNDYQGSTRTVPWDIGAYKYAGAGTVPVITTSPISQSVTTGVNVSFTAAATGTPTPTWQWQKDGSDIPGATSATYSITGVVLGDAGTYTAIATNTAGSATSSGAVLAVGVIPPTAPSTPATPIISIF